MSAPGGFFSQSHGSPRGAGGLSETPAFIPTHYWTRKASRSQSITWPWKWEKKISKKRKSQAKGITGRVVWVDWVCVRLSRGSMALNRSCVKPRPRAGPTEPCRLPDLVSLPKRTRPLRQLFLPTPQPLATQDPGRSEERVGFASLVFTRRQEITLSLHQNCRAPPPWPLGFKGNKQVQAATTLPFNALLFPSCLKKLPRVVFVSHWPGSPRTEMACWFKPCALNRDSGALLRKSGFVGTILQKEIQVA